MAAHQAPPSLGFSRQEHWSGLPFPSPVHESEKWKGSRSVVSDSSDPMDCSPPGSSIHGIFQARELEWGAIAFSDIYSLHISLLHTLFPLRLWQDTEPSVHGILQRSILEWVVISFSWGSSRPRDPTQVSCIAGRFFTVSAIREAYAFLCFTVNAYWLHNRVYMLIPNS